MNESPGQRIGPIFPDADDVPGSNPGGAHKRCRSDNVSANQFGGPVVDQLTGTVRTAIRAGCWSRLSVRRRDSDTRIGAERLVAGKTVLYAPADHRHQHSDVDDLLGVDCKWIFGENDQVGEFAGPQTPHLLVHE